VTTSFSSVLRRKKNPASRLVQSKIEEECIYDSFWPVSFKDMACMQNNEPSHPTHCTEFRKMT
jgi:hypothetical protein